MFQKWSSEFRAMLELVLPYLIEKNTQLAWRKRVGCHSLRCFLGKSINNLVSSQNSWNKCQFKNIRLMDTHTTRYQTRKYKSSLTFDWTTFTKHQYLYSAWARSYHGRTDERYQFCWGTYAEGYHLFSKRSSWSHYFWGCFQF